jgi:SNF2 family DNA or RNA helicase
MAALPAYLDQFEQYIGYYDFSDEELDQPTSSSSSAAMAAPISLPVAAVAAAPAPSPAKYEELKKTWDAYPKIEQPEDLQITLFPHQLVSVYNMEELERVRRIKYGENNFYWCDFGILGDIPGYGKSLSIVALLLRDKMKWDITKPHEHSTISTYNSSLKLITKTQQKRVSANLLVASPTLIEQWKEYFGFVKPDVLNIKEISHAKDLNNFKPDDYDVVICSSTRYNELINMVGHKVWKRFIFDEAGSTHITGMRHITAGFVWFVSATYTDLLHCHGNAGHYMKSFFSNFDYNMINHFVIKNDIHFVKHSFKMPEVKEIRHVCHNPRVLNVLSGYIDDEVKTMIGAGDIRGAINRLGGGVTTETNLFEIVAKRQNEKLAQARFSLTFWTNRTNTKEMETWNKKVKEIEKNIEELEEKYKNILKDDCSICYSTISNPVLLPCCQNIFCGGCIMTWFNTTKTCPMCRSDINIKEMVYVHSGTQEKEIAVVEKPKEQVVSKPQAVLNIIKSDLTKKYLIFSMYDESFMQIRRELMSHHLDYVEISGSKATRDSKIKKFKDNRVNIVFLNSRFNGAGINLEMATDVILYHEMPSSIEEQVIGRALRIGRKDGLTVHRLVFN